MLNSFAFKNLFFLKRGNFKNNFSGMGKVEAYLQFLPFAQV